MTAPGGPAPAGNPPRWLAAVGVAAAVLPIWVAAIRDGLRGHFPTADAAATVIRARDVFGGPFPLVGMPAAAATSDGYLTYFPGAWQLYVISVPTELFGNVWGPLVAMAVLNSVWMLLAGWLLLRRLRSAEALVGIAFLAVLAWSLGSGFLVTPVPMDMVIIPMALFLIAVWSVADGDLVAVPILAVVANFLWLDHLVLVVIVPVVGLCAPIGLWLWARATRRRDPEAYPERRRRIRRSLIAAGAITVVMWVPSVVQQFTTSPGNLRLLVASAGVDRPSVGSWPDAVHIVVSVVARPGFWFRGTLDDPSFLAPPIGGTVVGDLAVFDIVAGTLLIAAMVLLGVSAVRRADRTGLWLLIVAGAALALGVVSAYSAPGYFGTPVGYLRSLWPTAMLVWFALVLNALRAFAPRSEWAIAAPSLAVIVAVTVLNLPVARHGYDGDRRLQHVVKVMNRTVVSRLGGGEPVLVVTGVGFASQRLGAPLALALADAGVPYCIPRTELASNGGTLRRCPDGVQLVVKVVVTGDPDRAVTGDVLVRESLLDESDRTELATLTTAIDDWLDARDRLELTPRARSRLAGWLTPAQRHQVRELFQPTGGQADDLSTDPAFAALIRLWYSSKGQSTALFDDDPLDGNAWRRWLELSERNETLVVTESRPSRRR